MAWTPPFVWPSGHTVTAAEMNAYVRDNEKALITACRAWAAAGTVLPASSTTALTWAAVNRDPLGMWSAGSPTRITVPIAGTYRVAARSGGISAGSSSLTVTKSGVLAASGGSGTPGSGGVIRVGPTCFACVAGDYIEAKITTGGSTYTEGAYIAEITGFSGDLDVTWVAP